jgi:NAD(P)-dependent dehydrogenase (short-subunit alcohol dehydrogenase family)
VVIESRGMVIDLTGRVALVTGSTLGIGYAAAAGLHAAGAEVVINGRSRERVDAAVLALGGGQRLRGVAADVGTAEGCAALAQAAGEIDILVNNAGVYQPQPVFEIPDSGWEHVFAVNVMSGVRLARHYVPLMLERGWGRVLFISSESALHIPPEMVHYGMSKTAQLAVARGFAESIPRGTEVTINTVLAGPTRSDGVEAFIDRMVQEGTGSRDEAAQMLADGRPTSLLGRLTTPTEVANLIVYLASELASGTTGAAMRVDGGVVRAIA